MTRRQSFWKSGLGKRKCLLLGLRACNLQNGSMNSLDLSMVITKLQSSLDFMFTYDERARGFIAKVWLASSCSPRCVPNSRQKRASTTSTSSSPSPYSFTSIRITLRDYYCAALLTVSPNPRSCRKFVKWYRKWTRRCFHFRNETLPFKGDEFIQTSADWIVWYERNKY